MTSLPLAGVRVLDLSAVIMGPWCSHVLASHGASVIKVEAPAGDTMRLADVCGHPGMAPMFQHSNRGKRSVVLDLKQPGGLAAVMRLAALADVFVHNIRPVAAERLGIGWEAVRAGAPRIVYAALTGFGSDGPYGGRPAYDDLIQGASGLAAMFDPPRYVPSLIADRYVGVSAAAAILAALVAVGRDGVGRAIEVPMFETMAEFVLADHLNGWSFDPPTGPVGYSRIVSPNRRPYATRDGHICLIVYTEKHWVTFFTVAGRLEQFLADPILHQPEARRADFDRVYAMVADIVGERTTGEWLALLADKDVPVIELGRVETLIDDPHLLATGMLREVDDGGERARRIGAPVRWGEARPDPGAAPRLGEHTREVLGEVGYSVAEVDAMIAGGVAASAD
jgi:crotonobetainyl-CoA:carnitine CoA-transferase CaiB-like acyl-CoA transferase